MVGTHTVILVDNTINTKKLVNDLITGKYADFSWLKTREIGEFSQKQVERFIEEEELHDQKIISKETEQSLKSMSSGERKKALLRFLERRNPEVLLVINPYDSLDVEAQHILKTKFQDIGKRTTIIQIINRISDALSSAKQFYSLNGNALEAYQSLEYLEAASKSGNKPIDKEVPHPLKPIPCELKKLVEFKNVSVSFNGRPVLSNINWEIKKEEFWQLKGSNGSGKSTLLNLITGDSHKGYGQDLTVFGHKKGSGESVWDLKKTIGYFSPIMVDRFKGYHSLEHMLISGIHDSIGLYIKPSEIEKQKALEWLRFLELEDKKHQYFHELSIGAKRLVMTARAMIKHPPLLILDEPTVGLDDASASFFVDLVNAYAKESKSAVIFVSHRYENGLEPNCIFELVPNNKGSTGISSFA